MRLDDGEPLRVAIDLIDQDKDGELLQVWTDSLRAGEDRSDPKATTE